MKRNDLFPGVFPLAAAFLLAFLLVPAQGWAQDFPTKPITVYCGFEAGATTDLTARALAEETQKILGVPVVVENKPGGGSTVAASLLASKKPDGYTLAVVATSALDIRHLMLAPPYNPGKDFTFLLVYGNYVGGICVLTESPFKTLKDLEEHARKNPGVVSYSSSGIGANQQLAVDYWAKQAQISLKHVPFKGGAPACTALIGKHVDFTAGAGIHLNYVKQGIFRQLASTSAPARDPEFPDIPTLKDLGYKDLPPQEYILLAPKGLPDQVSRKLEEGFGKAAQSAEFKKYLKTLSVPLSYKDRRQLEAEFPKVYQFYSQVMNELGMKTKK
jgi:tripartite-type tricarboxylate transporter receptor subunit TctC